jgi:hypothetical protein
MAQSEVLQKVLHILQRPNCRFFLSEGHSARVLVLGKGACLGAAGCQQELISTGAHQCKRLIEADLRRMHRQSPARSAGVLVPHQ